MKRFFTFLPALVLALISTSAMAQGELKFETDNHDFTKVTEGTLATHEFKFKNVGNQPVVISNVQASCGCTTPDWTKEPIAPGKAGFVKAVYNSNGRPGVFNKTITVTSNAKEATKVLSIKGDVISKAEAAKNYTPEQKAKSPKVAILQPTYNFGKIELNRPVTAKIQVKNTGKEDLQIADVHAACGCVHLANNPGPIKANQVATLELNYFPNALDNRSEVVEINSNDIVTEQSQFTLKANVVKSLAAPSIVKEGTNSVPFK